MSTDVPTIWHAAVQKSFLATEAKARLLEMLQTSGATDEFIDAFDTMLADATDVVSEQCEATLQKFESAADALGAEYRSKNKSLGEKLKKDFAEAESAKKRDAVMDAYYAASEKLMEWHEAALKKTSEEILRSLV